MSFMDVDLIIADDVEDDDIEVDYNTISFCLQPRGQHGFGQMWTVSHDMTFADLRAFCARVLCISVESTTRVRVWYDGKALAADAELVRRLPRR